MLQVVYILLPVNKWFTVEDYANSNCMKEHGSIMTLARKNMAVPWILVMSTEQGLAGEHKKHTL